MRHTLNRRKHGNTCRSRQRHVKVTSAPCRRRRRPWTFRDGIATPKVSVASTGRRVSGDCRPRLPGLPDLPDVPDVPGRPGLREDRPHDPKHRD